ncbi:hypothetical protein, partial [Staphylococcus aureus]
GGLAPGDGYELTAIEPVEADPATLTAPGDAGGLSGGDNLRRWVDEHATGTSGADLVALILLLPERCYLSHGLTPATGAAAPAWTKDLPG